MLSTKIKIGAAVGLVLIALLLSMQVRFILAETLRWIDRNIAHEFFKELTGSMLTEEDWSTAMPLDRNSRGDSAWIDQQARPIRIAHALGAADSPNIANSLSAFRSTASLGIKTFEVDLWLDSEKRLRCFHGDENNTQPPMPQPDDCTFETLLPLVAQYKAWLILDIKNQFEETGDAIVNSLRDNPDISSRIIFQLYRPADLAIFSRWSTTIPLAAPIVTVYRSKRGLQHVADQMEMLGVKALTLPIERKNALRSRPKGVAWLVHPVHDLAATEEAKSWGADGAYIASSLFYP